MEELSKKMKALLESPMSGESVEGKLVMAGVSREVIDEFFKASMNSIYLRRVYEELAMYPRKNMIEMLLGVLICLDRTIEEQKQMLISAEQRKCIKFIDDGGCYRKITK
jgi:hypothetical protein